MQKKLVDNPTNVIPFDADTAEMAVDAQILGNEIHEDSFDKLVSQFYYARSVEQDTSSLGFVQELDKPSDVLAFEILTKPATAPRQILLKLNILENELSTELEAGAPLDGKYLVMFAGLKSDIIRVVGRVDEF